MIILGIHVSHDASAVILRNGEILGAVQEERLSRSKFHEGFPIRSIQYLLNSHGINPDQIDRIAIAGEYQEIEHPFFILNKDAKGKYPVQAAFSKLAAAISGRIRQNFLDSIVYNRSWYQRYIFDYLKLIGFKSPEKKTFFFDHHHCHAATAYYPSTEQRALIITQDGRGDRLSGSVWEARSNSMECLIEQKSEDSVAQLYALVTSFLGFTPLRHEGKITGLAAFGQDTGLSAKIRDLFVINEKGSIHRKKCSSAEIEEILSKPEKKLLAATHSAYHGFASFGYWFKHWLSKEAGQMRKEDVAWAIQDFSENIICEQVKVLIKALPEGESISIGLAGGLFANVKVNQRIREIENVRNVFVQPAMGDSGLSLGAALLAHLEISNLRPAASLHQYLGCSYDNHGIETELKKWKDVVIWEWEDHIERRIAELLHNGAIVGRFNGEMEFGPRALGNRSILIKPGDRTINDTVNKRLKRTEFMPFAPSVLDYRAKDYFRSYEEQHRTADWMTITYDVYQDRVDSIQAVVHVDNTARPQVVRKETNPSYYEILSEYEKLSGIGCLVNTSFNMHEEPIVASPYDALRALKLGSVDFLAMGNYLIQLR